MIFNYYKNSIAKEVNKKICIKKQKGLKVKLSLKIIYNLKGFEDKNKFYSYINELDKLITKEWGQFHGDFTKECLGNTKIIILIYRNNEIVGFTSMSIKYLYNKLIHYIEFTIVKKEYQNLGLAKLLNYLLLKEVLINNLIFNKSFLVELMFISPNIKTLVSLAKCSSFIYPNPFSYNRKSKKIPLADNQTWDMAKELIKKSGNPNRIIEREGCVLNNSYKETPWLIYGLTNTLTIPQHHNNLFNEFAEKYLKYKEKNGKEFIIRAKIDIFSVLKFMLLKK